MRGRLIAPLTAEIVRLSPSATSTAGAYDADFRTMVPGAARSELAPVRLRAQVEMGQWQAQRFLQAGNLPDSRLSLVFHFRELEQQGLVDVNGAALIRVGDRLTALYDRGNSILESLVPNRTGGLYITEAQPAGLGMGGRRNLLLCIFEDRPKGLVSNP